LALSQKNSRIINTSYADENMPVLPAKAIFQNLDKKIKPRKSF
jgi:hypothetical protein